MSKVLVTGATGFLGARVVRQLVAESRDVAILVRPSSNSRRIGDVLDRCHVIQGDLFRLDGARTAISRFAPEAVIHLAWDGVRGADRNSGAQLTNVTNAIGLYRLTEELGCSRFVGLGSQAEYGLLSGVVSESAPTLPTTVYGAAKLATGIVLGRAAASSGRPFVWLRLFSSYGPDDDPSWMIPYVIRSLLARERPRLTHGEQAWDYLYVDDVAAAVIAAHDSSVCGAFNLGSGHARPLRHIISLIRDMIDPALPLGFGEVPYRPDQVMHLEADITAFARATTWEPAYSIEEGLKRTVAWHQREDSHAS